MLRFLLFTLLSIFLLSVVRMIVAALSKGFSEMMSPPSSAGGTNQGAQQRPPSAAGGGPLKRDPVCGTYIPVDHSVRKVIRGETLYFCSPECRDKYV